MQGPGAADAVPAAAPASGADTAMADAGASTSGSAPAATTKAMTGRASSVPFHDKQLQHPYTAGGFLCADGTCFAVVVCG